MPCKKWIILFIMFMLCSGYVISQSKPLTDFNAKSIRSGKDEYITKVLGAKDGLPSSEILTLIQDEHGFVWIGTSFGVSRYDGFTFTNFLTCGNRQLGKTFSIVCDTTQHVIWIMSDAGLCYYSNGRLHEIIIKENDIGVYSLCIDQRNNYWMATSKGPAYFTQTVIPTILQTGNINIDEHILPAWKTFPSNKESIKKITTSNGDKIYFNSSNTAYSSDKKNINLIWQIPSPGDKIVSILSVSPDRIYFSSILTGIHAYSNQTVSSVSPSVSISANLFTAGNNIYHLNADGIHTLDTLNNALQIISTIPDNENKWLSCLMVDREDNFWIGMHHTLIFQQKKLFHTYNNIKAPEGTEFFSICKKKNSDILFGASNGKVYQPTENNIGFHYQLPNVYSEIKAIAEDSRGWIWYVTGVDGIVVKNGTHIQHIKTIEGQQLEGYSFLQEDDDGNIWTGGDGVLSKITVHKSSDAVTCKNYYSRLPGDNWFTFLGGVKGTNGKYWFAGAQGLFTFHNDSLQPYWFDNTTFRSNITSIQKDNNNEVWLSTKGEGIWHCFFDKNGDLRVKRKLGIREGLPGNIYTGLITDNHNNAWAVSYSGISRIAQNGSSYFISNYNAKQGFPDKNYHNAILYRENKYVIWVVTSSGLAWFNPSFIEKPLHNPMLVLNSIQVGDSTYFLNNPYKALELGYNKNNLSFNFSGIHFSNPQAIKYFYRLSGNDTNWIDNGNEKQINFQRLAPGKYTLQVKALLGNENGSSTITTHFIIKPPFWLSWWFLSGCVLLATGIVWCFILRREKAIRQKEAEKNKIRKQITELEIKALKSQMNPHFVFNSLNSIAHLIASNQNERGIEYLAKFSKLLRMILDEAENNFVLLKDEIKMLNLYLQIEALRFGETFGHTIYADDDIDEEEISVPALLVHPLAENAVWHGLLHKQGERRMIIHFKKISDNMLQCIVKDNGIGIEAAKAMKEARLNGSIQKSKGMQLVKDRLKMLEEQYNSPTFFSIADVHEEHALISGTVVTIQFPVLYAS